MLPTPADDSDAEPSGPATELEPRWLRALAFGGAAAVAAFGAVGVVLAVAGVARPVLVFPLGAIAWVLLVFVGRPVLAAPGSTRASAHAVGAAAVAFIAGVALWNAKHASQHVLINRDGGDYTNAAKWIAAHGNLRVVAAAGPFAHQTGLAFGSFGVYPGSDGALSFQFPHLLPAVLAQAHAAGGDRLMFATPALLTAVALLALFVAAWRILRVPWIALAAVVTFAFLLPEVSFSRDTYSELPTQVFLFTAVWILAARDAFRKPRVALGAGLLLGALQMARIDAMAELLGVPLLFALIWATAHPEERRSVARSAGACALGIAPGFVIGLVDVDLRSHQYLHDLRRDVKQLAAAMVGAIVVAIVIVAVTPLIERRRLRMARVVPPVAGAAVAVAGLSAWFVRPRVQHTHGARNALVEGLQMAAHVPVDGTRTYAEHSMVWMGWYLGPVTLLAALAFAGLLVASLLRGRSRRWLSVLALLGPASAIYLWRPNASPDQIWVMRRFLFSALPLLTLLAFGLVAALVRARACRVPRVVRVGIALVLTLAAIAYPLWILRPVRDLSEQRGDVAAVRATCSTVGRPSAIVLLQSPTGLMDQWAPQTLRDWCDVPVAILPKAVRDRRALLTRLATRWAATGTKLWVVADEPATISAVIPTAAVRSTPDVVTPFFLERALVRRPSHYESQHFSLSMAPVPTR